MAVKFIESSHQYLHPKGEMISVSKFTERFKEKVDWDKIAARSAQKASRESGTKVTKAQIQEKWANKRDRSAEIGTLYHNIRENELLAQNSPVFYNKVCNTKVGEVSGGFKHSIPINNIENGYVYPELMIYDEEHMICGQSDKVIVMDNYIHIWDYKTDAEITFKGYSNEWVKPRKLLAPLSHLDDCNGHLYSIKMSLYMYMLWKANGGRFKPGDIVIEHIQLERDPNNDNIAILGPDGKPVVKKIKEIHLPYRKKEVMAMLKTLK